MQIDKRIRELRQERGLTQSELGKRIGLSGGAVSHFEVGERMPSVVHLDKMASVLGVDPGEFFKDPTPRPKVLALPSTPLTDLVPEALDERLGALGGAAEVEKLLDQIRAEESDLEAFQVTTLPAKLTRARIYRVAILDRWSKLADPRNAPPKSVRQIADEVAGFQEWLRDFVEQPDESKSASSAS